jgi:hypothetical protein
VLPLKFPHQRQLFEAVFDFPYDNIMVHRNHQPVLIKHLAVPRRQTDMEHSPWRFSFAGIRHIRDAALRRCGHSFANPDQQPEATRSSARSWFGRSGLNKTPLQEKSATRAARPGLRIHLHRIQDVETLKQSGNLRGRNFTNFDALSKLLLAKGYVVYEPALLPLEHIVASLSQAETIVAIHGAGLANFVFSPPGTRVYEITGHGSTWRCLEALAAVLELDFTELCQPQPADPDKPFLDIEALASVL